MAETTQGRGGTPMKADQARAAMALWEKARLNVTPTEEYSFMAGWNACADAAADKVHSMKDAMAILALKGERE